MTERWLEEAVAASGLPPRSAFPRDLPAELGLSLRVTLVSLPGLTTDKVRDWLSRRGVRTQVVDTDRPLHGCMVARAGRAILFHDRDDDAREQRFTLAHEVAHFVLDHLLPRERALRAFGESIREVLDEVRPPTPEESLSSVLEGVPLGLQVRLMDRGASGTILTGRVEAAEQRADRLALELLAPAGLARNCTPDMLVSRFGLPEEAARTYARMLSRRARPPRFCILDFLGEDER